MKKNKGLFTLLIIVIPIFLNASVSSRKVKDLPEFYKKWLNEEVVYIITPAEREVFLELKNNRERDLFIKAFWKHRDPTQGTSRNEYKEEHYRRIEYANRRFRGAGKPGWKTDRGKVYIILGEPKTKREFRGSDSYYPSEVWYYQGLDSPLLPQAFHLLFYQKGRIGEYILYNPTLHGPWSLMTNDKGLGDYYESYKILERIEPQLASFSISLIPNESITRFPSIASSALLNNIDIHAVEKIKDRYARKFIRYKDTVETEYSINYIESDYLTQIIKDETGISYIHYTIEIDNISMGQYSQEIYTDLDFNGRITDKEGKTIYQFDKKIPLSFNQEEFEQIKTKPFNFYGCFPLIPGDYEFSLIVKNSVSKEFTSFEENIQIPEDLNSPYMTPLLLGFNAMESSPGTKKPFKIKNIQLYSQPGHLFIKEDNLFVFFQLLELSNEIRNGGSLKFVIFKEDQEEINFEFPLEKYSDKRTFLETFSLSDFYPGYYKIKVFLLDENGQQLANQQENFIISPSNHTARPWVISKSVIDLGQPQIYSILGKQYANKKDYEKSIAWLEKAYRLRPEDFDIAFQLAQSHFYLNNYNQCVNLLMPFSDKIEDYSYYYLLGRVYQSLSQYEKAIHYFNQAIANFGSNINLLNSLGKCHYQIGNKKKALSFFNQSLQINPNQKEIRQLVRNLKN